jgi:hypothetical protein
MFEALVSYPPHCCHTAAVVHLQTLFDSTPALPYSRHVRRPVLTSVVFGSVCGVVECVLIIHYKYLVSHRAVKSLRGGNGPSGRAVTPRAVQQASC